MLGLKPLYYVFGYILVFMVPDVLAQTQIAVISCSSYIQMVQVNSASATYIVRNAGFGTRPYHNNEKCSVEFHIPSSARIVTVKFIFLDLERNPSCSYDSLCVGGIQYCDSEETGHSYSYVIPAGQTFTLAFISDVSNTGDGFEVEVDIQDAISNLGSYESSSGHGPSLDSISHQFSSMGNYVDRCSFNPVIQPVNSKTDTMAGHESTYYTSVSRQDGHRTTSNGHTTDYNVLDYQTTDKGQPTTDKGYETTDIGPETTDKGYETTVKGYETTDRGLETTYKGYETTDRGPETTDKGYETTDKGSETTDEGYETTDRGPETTDKGYETTDRGSETTDEGYETTDRGPETTDKGYETTDRGSETTDEGYETTDRGPETTDKGYETIDRGYETTDKDYETTDRGPETTDKVYETTDKGPETTDKGSETTDRGPETTDKDYETTDKGPETTDKGYETTVKGYQTTDTVYLTTDKSHPTTDNGYETTYQGYETRDYQATNKGDTTTDTVYHMTPKFYQTDKSYQTTSTVYRTTDKGYETTDKGYETTHKGYQTKDNDYETTHKGYQTKDNDYETTDKDYATTDKGYEAPEKSSDSTDKDYQTTESAYKTSDSLDQTTNSGDQEPDNSDEVKNSDMQTTEGVPGSSGNYSAPTRNPWIRSSKIYCGDEPSTVNVISETSLYIVKSCRHGDSTGYADNERCLVVYVTPNVPKMFVVTFKTFDIEYHQDCCYDFLCIKGVKYCGDWAEGYTFRYVVPALSTFTMAFSTDESKSGRGFEIEITITDTPAQTPITEVFSGIGSREASLKYRPSNQSDYTDKCQNPIACARGQVSSSTTSFPVKNTKESPTNWQVPSPNSSFLAQHLRVILRMIEAAHDRITFAYDLLTSLI